MATLIQSCITYKKLLPVVQKGATCYGSKEDIERYIEHRPYFIFAFESQLTIDTISNKLNSYYSANKIPVHQQIDGVFCLDRGSIINFGDGKGSLQYLTIDGKSIPGIIVTRNTPSGVLLDIISWLSTCIIKYSLPNSPLTLYLIKMKLE